MYTTTLKKWASRRHDSIVVKYIQATIGYSTVDSSAQPAIMPAGTRSLSLAAALMCTRSYFKAGQALEQIIGSTAANN